MTKNLRGITSIWLSVIMLFSLVASPAYADAGNSVLAIASCDHPISAGDYFRADSYDVPTEVSVVSDAVLALSSDAIAVIGSDGELAGWEIWKTEGYGDNGYHEYVEKIAYKDITWAPSQDELNTYLPPVFSDGNIGYVVSAFKLPEVYVGGELMKNNVYYKNDGAGSVTSDGANIDNYNAILSVKSDGTTVLEIKDLNVHGKSDSYVHWGSAMSGWYPDPENTGIAAKGDITVNVTGNNSAKGVKNSDDSCAVGILSYGDMLFTGSGKLDISTSSDADYTCAIMSSDNSLDFNGPEITAAANSESVSSYGIYSYKASVNGGALNIIAGEDVSDQSKGIFTTDGFSLKSGKVKIYSGKAYETEGISSYGDIYITGGTVEIETSSDANEKKTISTYGTLYFSDTDQPDSNWYKWKTKKDGEWNISSDGNGYVPSSGETYVLITENSATEPKPEPKPEKPSRPTGGGGSNRYSIIFNTDGGSEIKKVNIIGNTKLNKPEDPQKEGYTFEGWYTSSNFKTEYDFNKPVTSSFTLYAKWTKAEIASDAGESAPGGNHTSNCPSRGFSDVETDVWYHNSVDFVIYKDLMNGYDNGLFGTYDNITRGMFVTVLWRIEGEPPVNRSIPFADVDAGLYYTDAVIWAKQNGIVNGVSETEFAPERTITREEMATIIYRYAGFKGYDISAGDDTENLPYTDYDLVSDFAKAAMHYVTDAKIMVGNSSLTLNPKENAIRAEVAVIFQRLFEKYSK